MQGFYILKPRSINVSRRFQSKASEYLTKLILLYFNVPLRRMYFNISLGAVRSLP